MHWFVGGFDNAITVQDACTQAGQSHAKRDGANGKVLPVKSSKGELKNYSNARCYFDLNGVNEGTCGLIQASPQCPPSSEYTIETESCLCNLVTKEQGGVCVPGTDCDEMVRRLKQIKIPSSDARAGFYRNQTCIAEKSCQARMAMEDKEWLNKVVPAFVNPLLSKSGEWSQVMNRCKAMSVAQSLRCQSDMADYHIRVDLQNALNGQGCGSENDWRKVGDIISQCVAVGVKEDVTPALNGVGRKN